MCPWNLDVLKESAKQMLADEEEYFTFNNILSKQQSVDLLRDLRYTESILAHNQAKIYKNKEENQDIQEDKEERNAINIYLNHLKEQQKQLLPTYTTSLDCLDQLLDYLQPYLRPGYEFRELFDVQYQIYGKKGFFLKHKDTVDDPYNPRDEKIGGMARVFSLLIYLTPDWTPKDGGELTIHAKDGDFKVTTEMGKVVFFKSDKVFHTAERVNTHKYLLTFWVHIRKSNVTSPNYKQLSGVAKKDQHKLTILKEDIRKINTDFGDYKKTIIKMSDEIKDMKRDLRVIKESLAKILKSV